MSRDDWDRENADSREQRRIQQDNMMFRQFAINGARLPKKTKTSKTPKTSRKPVATLPPARLLRATAAYLRDLEESVYNDALAKGPPPPDVYAEAVRRLDEAAKD